MVQLTSGNSRVDPGSGAIIFNGSPELRELMKLRKDIDTLNKNINALTDCILTLIKGGNDNGRKMENK